MVSDKWYEFQKQKGKSYSDRTHTQNNNNNNTGKFKEEFTHTQHLNRLFERNIQTSSETI